MELKELYEEYGKLQIQAEILNNRTMEVKRQIAELLNKPPQPPEEKPISKDSKK